MTKQLDGLLKEIGKLAEFKEPDKHKAFAARICVKCGLSAADRCYTDAGRREWHISGLCELCFDEIFSEDDDGHEAAEAQ